MTELTAKQVESAVYALDEDFRYWGEFAWSLERGYVTDLEVDGVEYPVELVEEKSGSEGDFDTQTYVVFKVGEQVFRKTGHYMSHYGDDWDGPLVEVVPVEKVVTVWVEKVAPTWGEK